MLIIREIKPSDLPVSVEVDPYVPIAVRTFRAPIGAVFYRVGNFKTSLVEVPIDPLSGTVRGIKLVSMDRLGTAIDDRALPLREGLPVTAQESIPQQRTDDQRDVTVFLNEDRVIIDWSNGQKPNTKTMHGRLGFFMGGGFLLGAAIESLTKAEQQLLLSHMPS